MRNGPDAYALSQQVPALVGNVGIAMLPAKAGEEPAGTPGGWSFGVTTDAGIASADPESGVVMARGVGSAEIRASRGRERLTRRR